MMYYPIKDSSKFNPFESKNVIDDIECSEEDVDTSSSDIINSYIF